LKKEVTFNCLATGIGSVPFLDVEETCEHILATLPHIPFWPQFVNRSFLEEMSLQASEGLPLFKIDHEKKALTISSSEDYEDALVAFYEHFMAGDTDYFAITPEYAAGLYRLLELLEESPQGFGPFVKGQIIGPITFAASLKDAKGKSALYNTEIMDTIVKGLAIKAQWLIKKMSLPDRYPIIFIDEPYLSGFGSAFTPIQREQVIAFLREMIEYISTSSDVLLGIHCCGNTDWSMIFEAGIDIVSFDAFGYMDHFLLYRKEIVEFLEGGGTIAWGVVPTVSSSGKETVTELRTILERGFTRLKEWGIPRGTIAERSLMTPACGLGSMEADKAQRTLELLSDLSAQISDLAP
jgi:hypothetical protein